MRKWDGRFGPPDAQPPLLGRGHRLDGMPVTEAAPRLDLAEDQRVVPVRDDVDLTPARAVVAPDRRVAEALEMRYREVLSGYLREEAVGPVPIRRLAQSYPEGADRVFQKLLKKPEFNWGRDGEALLRRYKASWYAEPPLPRVMAVSPLSAHGFGRRSTKR